MKSKVSFLVIASIAVLVVILWLLFPNDSSVPRTNVDKTPNASSIRSEARVDQRAGSKKKSHVSDEGVQDNQAKQVDIGEDVFSILSAYLQAETRRDSSTIRRCIEELRAQEVDSVDALTISYAAMYGSPEMLFAKVPPESKVVREVCSAAQFAPSLRVLALGLDQVLLLSAICKTLPAIEAHFDREKVVERYRRFGSLSGTQPSSYEGILSEAELALCEMASFVLISEYSSSSSSDKLTSGKLSTFFEGIRDVDVRPIDTAFRVWTRTLTDEFQARPASIEALKKRFSIPDNPTYSGDLFWFSGFIHRLSSSSFEKLSGYQLANLKRAFAQTFQRVLLKKDGSVDSFFQKQLFDFCGLSIELDPIEMIDRVKNAEGAEAATKVLREWFSSPYFLERDFGVAYPAILQAYGENAAISMIFSLVSSPSYSKPDAKSTLYTVLIAELSAYQEDSYSRILPLLVNLANVVRLHSETPSAALLVESAKRERVAVLGQEANLALAKRLYSRHKNDPLPNAQALASIASIAIESGSELTDTKAFLVELFDGCSGKEASNALMRGQILLWRLCSLSGDSLSRSDADTVESIVAVISSLMGRDDIEISSRRMLPNFVVSLATIPRVLKGGDRRKESLFSDQVLNNADWLLREYETEVATEEGRRYAYQDLAPVVRTLLAE